MKSYSRDKNHVARGRALSRRHFLKGLGAVVALPAFESLLPRMTRAFAAEATGSAAISASGAPLRMAFVYIPNGVMQANWWPTGEGENFELNRTMAPLENVKDELQIFGGLEHLNATPGADGAGDHARANATFLTGVRARKTAGSDIHVGVSIDQIAARQLGHLTRFPSLELTCDSVRKSGGCDSEYSCAYQYNLSWQGPATPMAPEPNPRLVFERLFGAGAPTERQQNFKIRQDTQKSVLDFVMDDARSVQRQLGSQDQRKLDEYLTSVREIEQRIQHAEAFGKLPDPHSDSPAGIPTGHGEHMTLMFDLLAMAFQTDSTRIATLLLAADGSNRAYPQINIPEGHHFLSHHRGEKEKLEKVALIDKYYMEHLGRFLDKLAAMKDVDGHSVLHNSMIVYGCGNGDGNRHNHDNLPALLAGSGGGTLQSGRYVKVSPTPMTNLFLSMADRFGVKDLPRFGDSTARLSSL